MEARYRLHQRRILWPLQHARTRGRGYGLAQHEGWANADDIDILQSDGLSTSQIKQGSNADYKALYNKVKNADLNKAIPILLAEVEASFDIDNMFDYYIFESFYGNTDPGNVRFYRNTKSGDGKWALSGVRYGLGSVQRHRQKQRR